MTLSHHLTAIDANYEIVPRLNWNVQVLVAKHLEAICGMGVSRALRWTIGIKPGYEAVESPEHY